MRSLITVCLTVCLALAAACGRVIAPPPPSDPPAASQEAMVPGVPITIAGRAARVLQEYGFTTRRFSSDSTWGWRANEQVAARLRYMPSRDSTRVLLELWGRCMDARTCMRGDIATIFARLAEQEAPPP